MDEAIRNGKIFAIEEVLRELQRKDDDVYKWVKEREEMIVSIDDEIQGHLVDIMSKYGRLVDSRKNRSGGDPWVIALAQAHGLPLLQRRRRQERWRSRIYRMCAERVECHVLGISKCFVNRVGVGRKGGLVVFEVAFGRQRF